MKTSAQLKSIGMLLFLATVLPAQDNKDTASGGPPRGSLVMHGGGAVGREIIERFIQLAGGLEAPVVFVPTANEGEPNLDGHSTFLAQAGKPADGKAVSLQTVGPVEYLADWKQAPDTIVIGIKTPIGPGT